MTQSPTPNPGTQSVQIESQHRCPYCHQPVQPTEEKTACNACMAWHHADCATEHGRCATCARDFSALPAGVGVQPREPQQVPEVDETLRRELPSLTRMAAEFVHWVHARVVLKAERPDLNEEVLEAAYRVEVVARALGADDPRPERVFDSNLAVARGHSGWLHADALKPIKRLSKAALKSLPWSMAFREGSVKVHPMKVEIAASTSTLRGYPPIRPVRGARLTSTESFDDEIVVEIPPSRGEPVCLLDGDELLDQDTAFAELEQAFPGISRSYLLGLLAGAACMETPTRPAIVFASGPSGSGKGETARLAASFLGDLLPKVQVGASDERFTMQIGSSLEEGRRILLLDEVGKVKNKQRLMRRLLEISTSVTWRPLYVTGSATTPNRAVLVLAHLSIPSEWSSSPEFVRRVRAIRLNRAVPRWEESCGGDSAGWRGRHPENAQVANSLLTHAVRLAERHNFDWDSVADELGIGRPDVEEADEQAPLLLYQHCRNEDGKREFFASGRYREAGWVNLRSRGATALLDGLLAEDTLPAWETFKHRLESLDWNSLLGIEEVDVICEVRFHGRQRAIRFRSQAGRGHWLVNDQLPAARLRQGPGRTDTPWAA